MSHAYPCGMTQRDHDLHMAMHPNGTWPEPAPEITEDEAVNAVVMLLDGREDHAFGEALDYWHDVLLNAVCEPDDFRFLLLLGLGRGEGMSATRHFADRLRLHIHQQAQLLTDRTC